MVIHEHKTTDQDCKSYPNHTFHHNIQFTDKFYIMETILNALLLSMKGKSTKWHCGVHTCNSMICYKKLVFNFTHYKLTMIYGYEWFLVSGFRKKRFVKDWPIIPLEIVLSGALIFTILCLTKIANYKCKYRSKQHNLKEL